MKTQTKAIVAAIVVLALALGTVSGVTYSWFTDSESSGPITVTSGNLDLEVEYTIDGENWDDIDDAENLFTGPWEPGHIEVVALKIKNEGSLALKYTAYMNIIDLVKGTNLDNEEIDLSKHLTVSTIVQQASDDEGNESQIGSITLSLAFAGENEIAYEKTSIMADDKCLISENNNKKTERELHPGVSHYLIVKVDMPETVGNEINYETSDSNNPDDSTNIPSIVLGIDLIAAQFNSESDSFGTGYDKDAEYEALLKDGNNYSLAKDVTFTDKHLLHNYEATEDYTFNGNGNTFTGVASGIDAFQWKGGTIPAMSTIFSSENGSKVTVNDLTFTGTMSAVMAGHYQNATYSNYNTEFNNVNIIDAKVVSFSANISPALCVYGTMVMNECTIKGTTLSPLDTDPEWPVYDMAVVNYSDTTLNDCVVGTIYVWNQAKLTVADGSEVGKIVVRGNMNTTKYGITIKAGATVGIIDLTAITDKARVNITIEEGATVGSIVYNGVSYSSIDSWKNGVVVYDAGELEKALENLENGDIIVLGGDIAGDMTVAQASGVGITIDGAGKTFKGALTVDGGSGTHDDSGLTIRNVVFKSDSISSDACINLGNGDNNTRYVCNVTIEGCTFDVPGAVGVKSYTGGDKNLTIKDCIVTERCHSMIQVANVNDVLIKNCEVYSKNGLNFNQSVKVTIEDCIIDVNGYAVRFGASSGGTGAAETYLIKNCTLKSANDDGDAVIILRGTADNSTLTIENTTISGTPDITNTATNATVIK